MSRRAVILLSGGFSLLELLFVLTVLGICLAAGSAALADGLRCQEARGAAQTWQAAAAWAQVGVIWQGGSARLTYGPGTLSLAHDYGLCGGDLGASSPAVPATSNLARWRADAGVTVAFEGTFGSPDGGGSVYFHIRRDGYRVVVRPESGLTVRGWAEAGQ